MLRTPAPGAALESFGDSALLFNLRISLPDIDKAGGVQSDLRVAIFKALRAAGIEIPFNQVDVNLRDLEAIKRYLSEVLDQRPQWRCRRGSPQAAAAVSEWPARRRRDVGRPRACLALNLRGRPSRAARGAPGLRARGWRWDGRRGA